MRTIRAAGVTTIFPESSVNPKLTRAIARDAGAKVGPALYADSLGPEGSPGATYLGSLRANTLALVDGFSGGRQTLPAAELSRPQLYASQALSDGSGSIGWPARVPARCGPHLEMQVAAVGVARVADLADQPAPVMTAAPFFSGERARRCM